MEKIRKDRQHGLVLYSLNESLQTFTGYESFFWIATEFEK